MSPIARQHPDKDLQLWFENEARVGPKGRATHVWFEKGVRPTAPADKRFASVSLFGAVRAGTDEAFALVMPFATAAVMSVFLQELNPVEGVWLYLREQSLSHRVWDTVEAIFEACCTAWNDLVAEEGRLASLTGYPYLKQARIS